MITTKSHEEIRAELESKGVSESDRVAYFIDDARDDHRRKVEQLKRAANWIEDKMQRLQRECDKALAGEPISINSLGELQGQGSELDRLCGELHSSAHEVVRLQALFRLESKEQS